MTSIALAMMEYSTLNEVRKFMDLEPLSEEDGGEYVRGLDNFYGMQMEMLMASMQPDEPHGEAQGSTSMREKGKSTSKKAASMKEPEKNKRVAPVTRDTVDNLLVTKQKARLKDAINNLRSNIGVTQLCKEMGIYDKTLYKMLQWSEN